MKSRTTTLIWALAHRAGDFWGEFTPNSRGLARWVNGTHPLPPSLEKRRGVSPSLSKRGI